MALVLLTIPLYGLFEGSIIMVAYVERGKAHRQARVEERRKKREIDRDTAKQKATSALVVSPALRTGFAPSIQGLL